MISIIGIQFIILTMFFTIGCGGKTKDQTTPTFYNFSGIVVHDNVGFPMATWGIDDGDWSTDVFWSEEEFNLLDFPDTVSLDNTYIKDTTGWNTGTGIPEIPHNFVVAYPNPVNNKLIMIFRGLGLLKFKATIVDKYYNSVFTYVCKDSSTVLQLDVSDSTIFQNGTIYRMYYSFSAKDSLNFFKGHGDILICRESGLQECQKYVP
ncbi:MAG: hypothetical protein QM503_13765 [Bacteroidota bacterium]